MNERRQLADSLQQVLARDHELIKRLCHAAVEAVTDDRERWQQLVASDSFLAIESRHLAAVEDVLYPAVRRRLPDGKAKTRAHAHEARALERMMRRVFAAMYGEVHELYARRDELLADTEARLMTHIRFEEELASAVEQTLSPERRGLLVEAYEAHFERGPTRPHPYTPHASPLGRFARKLWSVFDRMLDVMDNRLVPRRVQPPRAKPASLLDQYLTGQPDFPTEDQPERGQR